MAGEIPSQKTASNAENSKLLGDYMRKDELAQEFEVSERTIERWVRLRLLPAPVKLGRSTLFHVPSLQTHLAKLGDGKASARSRR